MSDDKKAPEPSWDDEAWANQYPLPEWTGVPLSPFDIRNAVIAGRQSLRAELDRVTAALARAEETLKWRVSETCFECHGEDLAREALRDIAALKGKE